MSPITITLLLLVAMLVGEPVQGLLRVASNYTFPATTPFGVRTQNEWAIVPSIIPTLNQTVSYIAFLVDSPATYTGTDYYHHQFPEAILLLSALPGSAAICTNDNLQSSVPCATLGFYTTGKAKPWLFLTNFGHINYFENITLPFNCSDVQPCTIRTQGSEDGQLGGCKIFESSVTSTVVVTWERKHYIFNPLTLATGNTSVHIVPIDWPAAALAKIPYDPSLQFSDLLSFGSCGLQIIHYNGSVEVYNLLLTDPTTETGFKMITKLPPQSEVQPCIPSVTNVAMIGGESEWQTTAIVVTCVNGEGRIWALNGPPQIGYFSISPPSSAVDGQPLVTDIVIALVLISQSSQTLYGYLTTIALLGTGYYQPMPAVPDDDEDCGYVSMAIFMSDLGENPSWLTNQTLYTSTVETQGQMNIESTVQYLRNGLGWIIPGPTLPAYVATNDYTDADVGQNALRSAILWLASMACYTIVTGDYKILINGSTGLIADPSPIGTYGDTMLVGGAYFAGPIRLTTTTLSYTRLQTRSTDMSCILLTSLETDSNLLLLFTPSFAPIDIIVENSTQFADSSRLWAWTVMPVNPSYSYTPSPTSASYDIPISLERVSLIWGGMTPILFAQDKLTGTVALVTTMTLDIIQGETAVSFELNEDPGIASASISAPSTESYPMVFMCHGTTVSCYHSSIGLELWTYDFVASSPSPCPLGSCECASFLPISVSPNRDYVVATFFDESAQATGLVVLNFTTGKMLSYYDASNFGPNEFGVNEAQLECDYPSGPSLYLGAYMDLSQTISRAAFAFVLTGTRCVLFAAAKGPDVFWGLFKIMDVSVELVANVSDTIGPTMFVSEIYANGNATGGRVFALDVTVMWEVLEYNPMGFIFGVNPTFVLGGIASTIAVDDLVVALIYQNITSELKDIPFLQQYQLQIYDGLAGNLLWNTSWVDIDERYLMLTASTLNIFVTYEGEANGAVAWVCASAGQLSCIVVSKTPEPLMYFPSSFSCIGIPSMGINRFLLYVSDGSAPKSFPLNSGYIGWVYGTSALTVSFDSNSCSDSVLSNDGLLMRCAMPGSNGKRLTMLNAQTGHLLFAYGPKVQPLTYSLSLDGTRLTYVEEGTGTAKTIQFSIISTTEHEMPVNTTVCGSDGNATYVLTFNPLNLNATRTAFDPNTDFTVSSCVYDEVQTESLSTLTVSFNSLIGVTSGAITSYLGPSLLPAVYRNLITEGVIYLQVVNPTYVIDASFTISLMAANTCEDCHLDCPQFCVLQVNTGDQIRFTSRVRSITGLVKYNGNLFFNDTNNTENVHYSGNVTLNAVRFLWRNKEQYQNITCREGTEGITTVAPAGRYCFVTPNSLSSIEFGDKFPALAATYRSATSSPAHGVGDIEEYYSYSTWSVNTILSVHNEAGLSPFLVDSIKALPDRVPASNKVITNIESTVLNGNTLTVTTDAGDLLYTKEACADSADTAYLPLCPQSFPIFDPSTTDKSIVTISWTSIGGSNWGTGFVVTGYTFELPDVTRDVVAGIPVPCTLEKNTDPQCVAACQATTACSSQLVLIVLTVLYQQSWLPAYSSLSTQSHCFDNDRLGVYFKLYGTSAHDVMLTANVGGVESVVFVASPTTEDLYGVAFKCSHCVYFNLPNIVAQPFGWLAICAIKSLFLTLAFYFAERHIRWRERQRDVIRDKIKRIEALLETKKPPVLARKDQEDITGSIVLSSSENVSTNSLYTPANNTAVDFKREGIGMNYRRSIVEDRLRHANAVPTEEDIEQLEFELADCVETERKIRFCGPVPNVLDRGISHLLHLAGFRHSREKEGIARRVRTNSLSKEIDDHGLIDLLLFVLKEGRHNTPTVAAFALFYEWNMCSNKSWVIRQRPIAHSGSDGLSSTIATDLARVHSQLRNIYTVFKKSHLCAVPLENLKRLDAVSRSSSEPPRERDAQAPERDVKTGGEFSPLLSPNNEGRQSLNTDDPVAVNKEFVALVESFNELHTTEPNCFEYAVLSSRRTDAQLQPSTILLTLSLGQSVMTLFLYIVDVYLRSRATPITSLQMYECIYFMVFNSSLPSTLLVNAIFHADLGPSMRATTIREWSIYVIKKPFVIMSLALFAPALVTHVIPGLLLYAWILLPPIVAVIGIEYKIRRTTRRTTMLLVAARVCTRIAILLVIGITFSIAFNVANAYIWQRLPGEQKYITGSYRQQPYLFSLAQDYQSRSLSCAWEHLFDTVSNFVQMGFFFV